MNSNQIVKIVHVNVKRMLISLRARAVVIVVAVVCADYISQFQLHFSFGFCFGFRILLFVEIQAFPAIPNMTRLVDRKPGDHSHDLQHYSHL